MSKTGETPSSGVIVRHTPAGRALLADALRAMADIASAADPASGLADR
jgi:hypothetical protein